MNNYQFTSVEEIKRLSAPMIASNNGAAFRSIDYERFKSKFGVTPDVCSLVWNEIATKLNSVPPIPGFSLLRPIHILFALFFLKVYPTVRQAVAALGRTVGTNQFRKYAYFIIRQIAALNEDVVSISTACLLLYNYSI